MGVASDDARAGHEPSQQAVSAVPVTVANAGYAKGWHDAWEAARGTNADLCGSAREAYQLLVGALKRGHERAATASYVKASPDDTQRAEKFRLGIGGRYDRDVIHLADEFAQCRRAASDEAARLCELVEAEAWGNPAEQAGASNCAKAIRGWAAK